MVSSELYRFAFSPNGQTLAAVSNEGAAVVLNPMTGGEIRVVNAMTGGFRAIGGLEETSGLGLSDQGHLYLVDGSGNLRTSTPDAPKWKARRLGNQIPQGVLIDARAGTLAVFVLGRKQTRHTLVLLRGSESSELTLPEKLVATSLMACRDGAKVLARAGDGNHVLWRVRLGRGAADSNPDELMEGAIDGESCHASFAHDGRVLVVSKDKLATLSLRAVDGRIQESVVLPFAPSSKILIHGSALGPDNTEVILACSAENRRPGWGLETYLLRWTLGTSEMRLTCLSPANACRLGPFGRFAVVQTIDSARFVLDLTSDRACFTTDGRPIKTEIADIGLETLTGPSTAAGRDYREKEKVIADPRNRVELEGGPPPPFSWGGLFVRNVDGSSISVDRVKETLTKIYGAAGLYKLPWSDPHSLIRDVLGARAIDALAVRREPTLGDDEVLVISEIACVCSVLSRAWEWGPVAQHPLAEALAEPFEVLSVQSVQGKHCSYVRYRSGQAIEMTWVGSKRPKALDALPEIDLEWLAETSPLDSGELLQRLHAPDEIVKLCAGDLKGHRDAFECAPLEDYGPESFLVFRSRADG